MGQCGSNPQDCVADVTEPISQEQNSGDTLKSAKHQMRLNRRWFTASLSSFNTADIKSPHDCDKNTERDIDMDTGHENGNTPASVSDELFNVPDAVDNVSIVNVAPSISMSPSHVSLAIMGFRSSHSGSASYISSNISTITPCSGMTSRQSSHNFSFKLDRIPDDYIHEDIGGSTKFTTEENQYLRTNVFGGSFNSLPVTRTRVTPVQDSVAYNGDNITL